MILFFIEQSETNFFFFFFLNIFIYYLLFVAVFFNSGFIGTLCGSKWNTLTGSFNAFTNLGTSTARYGCCPPGKYMLSSEVNPFVVANSCRACSVGRFSVDNDGDYETSCQLCAIGTCSAASSAACATCSKMPDGCKGITWISGSTILDRSCYPRKAVDELIALKADGSGTHSVYGPMKDWDMSQVTDLSYLFKSKTTLNADLSKWMVSHVTTMKSSM